MKPNEDIAKKQKLIDKHVDEIKNFIKFNYNEKIDLNSIKERLETHGISL